MREAELLFDQSQFPTGDGAAHDPNLQHSCGSLRCQPLFVYVPFKGFSDDDLASIVDGGYSPDKKKGKW